MKARTEDFKSAIKGLKEIDNKITYTINGITTELGNEELNSVQPHYEGGILKSVMKELDLESIIEIPNGTIINYQFGVLVNGSYEYLNFGNYIVHSSEKQEDTNSYLIKCYDKMLYSMVDYESFTTYPITIRNYISAICNHLGLTFKNINDTFVNYDKTINSELYLDSNGNSLGYKFRDVLDELAQVTASTICINENDDELEVRYLNDTPSKNLIGTKYIVANIKDTTMNNFTYSDCWGTPIVVNTNIMNILLPSTTYTISFKFKVLERPSSFGQYNHNNIFVLYKPNGNWIAFSSNYKNTGTLDTWYEAKTTFTTPSDLSGYNLLAYDFKDPNNNTVGRLEISELQIELGTTQNNYEPYGMDMIDEEYFNEDNVNFGEIYGPVNTIILSRSAESDEIAQSIPSNLSDDEKIAIKISNNQILNFDDREEYLDEILNKLYGLTYTQNSYSSKGICYYNVCDKYAANIFGKIYNCVMLNDDITIENGLSENVFTEMPETAETDYSKTSTTDKTIRKTTLIVDKQLGEIRGVVEGIDDEVNGDNGLATRMTRAETTLDSQQAKLAFINEDGSVQKVRTETDFTFDANGLRIGKSTDDFNSLQDNTGTYYYEKDTMTGKYTKDGSVQKDLALFGTYYYGIEETLDVADFTREDALFVAQLYNNGTEDGFGHFWNGE